MINLVTLIKDSVDIRLQQCRVLRSSRSLKRRQYKWRKRNLGALCMDIQACHTYFCGTKLPIAADMEGARFVTSQWV